MTMIPQDCLRVGTREHGPTFQISSPAAKPKKRLIEMCKVKISQRLFSV
jgi:hypothetical protein